MWGESQDLVTSLCNLGTNELLCNWDVGSIWFALFKRFFSYEMLSYFENSGCLLFVFKIIFNLSS